MYYTADHQDTLGLIAPVGAFAKFFYDLKDLLNMQYNSKQQSPPSFTQQHDLDSTSDYDQKVKDAMHQALQTPEGALNLFDLIEERRTKAMKTNLEPTEAIEEFCIALRTFWYFINTIKKLEEKSQSKDQMIYDFVTAKAH